MVSTNTIRQRLWREQQAEKGLVQVRVNVPRENARELKAIGEAIRLSVSNEPPAPKQVYRLKRFLKGRNVNKPAKAVLESKWRLEVWLIMRGA